MNPDGPSATFSSRDTKIRELEELLAATREDLAQTRSLLTGAQRDLVDAESALGLANSSLEQREAELESTTATLQGVTNELVGARGALRHIQDIVIASNTLRLEGIELGGNTHHVMFSIIGRRARLGLSDDEQG